MEGQLYSTGLPVIIIMSSVLITAALPYVNNTPHLGNIIGSTLSGDVYARYRRQKGDRVLYVCGTDQYGTQTVIKAAQEGVSCEELCNKYHDIHKNIYDWFGINFDVWGATTTDTHTALTQEVFKNLYNNGHIEERTISQLHCSKCNLFLADRFIAGTCYHRDCTSKVHGDQCDTCGKLIDIPKIIRPHCSICGTTPTVKPTTHLYIKLGDFQEMLEKYTPGINMTPNAVAITKGWLQEGLHSRCITRDLKWGTPVPLTVDNNKDNKLEKYSDKVFYVWFDAPIGYYSIIKHNRKDWQSWLSRDTNLVQFLGKDNVPFHSILFPATLLGANMDLPIVSTISCTEYLSYEGEKFSKSKNIGIFGDTAKAYNIPADCWRYYLLKIRPETHDTDFALKDFATTCTSDLVKNYGNYMNRCITMIKRYSNDDDLKINLTPEHEVVAQMVALVGKYVELMNEIKLKDAVRIPIEMTHIGNKYLQKTAPWEAYKKDNNDPSVIVTLALSLWVGCLASTCLLPFMPTTMNYVLEYINMEPRIDICGIGLKYDVKMSKDQYIMPFKPIDL